MSFSLESVKIEIACPICGRKIRKSLGWIKSTKTYTCRCGIQIEFDLDQLCEAMRKMESPSIDSHQSTKNLDN
jgi:hypothetical protein